MKKKNSRLFFLFVFITLIIIILFIFCLKYVLSKEKTKYKIDNNTILFTQDGEIIEPESNSYVSLNWNNNYYLYEKNKNIKLGKYSLSYNKSNSKINYYGTLYKVNLDADVEILKKFIDISNIDASFYKIDDRKYLFIDSNIISEDNSTLSTSNFVIIDIDKKGNASFINNVIDFKTINNLKIRGSKFTFDIPNEQLIVNDKFIDLKNVIGSSNEYKQPEIKTDPLDNVDYLTDNFNKYMNSISSDTSNNVTNNYNTNNNASSTEKLVYSKWINLTSVTSSVNYIDVNYLIFDPYNDYSNIYLQYYETGTEDIKTININKENNKYSLYGLKPITQYNIELKYNYQGSEYTSDSLIVKTLNPDYKLIIDKVDYSNKIIYYTISSNNLIKFDAADINFYSGVNKLLTKSLTSDECLKASTKEGLSGSFNFSTLRIGDIINIKMENIIYNGQNLNFEYYTKFINK